MGGEALVAGRGFRRGGWPERTEGGQRGGVHGRARMATITPGRGEGRGNAPLTSRGLRAKHHASLRLAIYKNDGRFFYWRTPQRALASPRVRA